MNLPIHQANKFRGYIVLSIISLLFVGPFIAASVYFFYSDKENIGTMNRGTLIQPPVHINDLNILGLNRQPLTEHSIDRKWVLLVNSAKCDDVCLNNIHKVKQLRLALAKEMGRVIRMLITQSPISAEQVATIHKNYPETLLARIEPTVSPQVLATDGIYLIDPRGFIIMQYPLDVGSEAIYKDLTHLLKYSHIG